MRAGKGRGGGDLVPSILESFFICQYVLLGLRLLPCLEQFAQLLVAKVSEAGLPQFFGGVGDGPGTSALVDVLVAPVVMKILQAQRQLKLNVSIVSKLLCQLYGVAHKSVEANRHDRRCVSGFVCSFDVGRNCLAEQERSALIIAFALKRLRRSFEAACAAAKGV